MRIISKFHDYYDKVQGAGQDFDLIYLRNQEKESTEGVLTLPDGKKMPNLPLIGSSQEGWRYSAAFSKSFFRSESINSFNVSEIIIGFCNKIYGALLLNEKTICYKIEEVDAFVHNNFKKKQIDAYYNTEKHSKNYRNLENVWDWRKRRHYLEMFFLDLESKKEDYKEFFIQKKCPVWSVAPNLDSQNDFGYFERVITYHEQLSKYDFVKVVNPFQAYQEIQMFLGGLASPEKPIPPISDKDMLIAKGFDKWSFKKPPSK